MSHWGAPTVGVPGVITIGGVVEPPPPPPPLLLPPLLYPEAFEHLHIDTPKGLLDDLKKLLKLSHIG